MRIYVDEDSDFDMYEYESDNDEELANRRISEKRERNDHRQN